MRFLSQAGIHLFLDIGSGLPTEGNVHEIAQTPARGWSTPKPTRSRSHSRTILAGSENTVVIRGDLREPEQILADDATRRLIDFSQPVGLLLVSILHHIADAHDPWKIVAALRDVLASGSCLVICHGTDEGRPSVVQIVGKMFNHSVAAQSQVRSAKAGVVGMTIVAARDLARSCAASARR